MQQGRQGGARGLSHQGVQLDLAGAGVCCFSFFIKTHHTKNGKFSFYDTCISYASDSYQMQRERVRLAGCVPVVLSHASAEDARATVLGGR